MEQIIEFAGNHLVLVSAFIVVLAMLVATEISRATRGFDDIDPSRLTRLMNHEDTLLLDTRTIGEYRQGHILHSRHMPTHELASRMGELEKHRDAHIVVYCRSGNRSAVACKMLKNQGFEKIYNLGGGIMAWQGASLPTTTR